MDESNEENEEVNWIKGLSTLLAALTASVIYALVIFLGWPEVVQKIFPQAIKISFAQSVLLVSMIVSISRASKL